MKEMFGGAIFFKVLKKVNLIYFIVEMKQKAVL